MLHYVRRTNYCTRDELVSMLFNRRRKHFTWREKTNYLEISKYFKNIRTFICVKIRKLYLFSVNNCSNEKSCETYFFNWLLAGTPFDSKGEVIKDA